MKASRIFILAGLTAVFWLVCVPATAEAHHVVSEYGITEAEPRTLTEVSLGFRQFDFGADVASGQAASLRLAKSTGCGMDVPTFISTDTRPGAGQNVQDEVPSAGGDVYIVGGLSVRVLCILQASGRGAREK